MWWTATLADTSGGDEGSAGFRPVHAENKCSGPSLKTLALHCRRETLVAGSLVSQSMRLMVRLILPSEVDGAVAKHLRHQRWCSLPLGGLRSSPRVHRDILLRTVDHLIWIRGMIRYHISDCIAEISGSSAVAPCGVVSLVCDVFRLQAESDHQPLWNI